MNEEDKAKLIKMANRMGVELVDVKSLDDILEKCDEFTMITNFSETIKSEINRHNIKAP